LSSAARLSGVLVWLEAADPGAGHRRLPHRRADMRAYNLSSRPAGVAADDLNRLAAEVR
jgi:hypothetical protein